MKTAIAIILAASLAGCSGHYPRGTYHIATGVDAKGAVVWETVIPPISAPYATSSLSDGPLCPKPKCAPVNPSKE